MNSTIEKGTIKIARDNKQVWTIEDLENLPSGLPTEMKDFLIKIERKAQKGIAKFLPEYLKELAMGVHVAVLVKNADIILTTLSMSIDLKDAIFQYVHTSEDWKKNSKEEMQEIADSLGDR